MTAYRHCWAGTLVLTVFCSASITVGQEQAQPTAIDTSQPLSATPRAVPGQIIVKPRDAAQTPRALAASDALNLQLEAAPRVTSGGELIYRLRSSALSQLQSAAAAQARIEEIVATLNNRSDIEYAQSAWIAEPHFQPNDTFYARQWSYHNNGSAAGESPGGIGLPDAWDHVVGDTGINVAVLDTGILPGHPDITSSPNLGIGLDMITNPATANDGDGRDPDPTDPGDAIAANECFPGNPKRDDSWHGSHVAGTVGVVKTNNNLGVAGTALAINVIPVRVLGKCGGSFADIHDAIRWAAGLPVPGLADNPKPAHVINMSLGTPPGVPCSDSPATQAAIDDAVAAGALIVVSAGNDAGDTAESTPSSCNNVMNVAASDYRGHLAERYSNFGALIDIMAPGGDVLRDDNGDGDVDGVLSTVQGGYVWYNGTSMAAPHVAGAAALVLADDPSRSASDVQALLETNALSRSATECPEPCGAGLLNLGFLAKDDSGSTVFHYASKMVCGTQKDPEELRFTRGRYATTINVHNPGPEDTRFRKWFELAIPPGFQEPGEHFKIGEDELPVRHSLATSCLDLQERVFGGGMPADYFDGYVVIESPTSLDVTAVYTSAQIGEDGAQVENSSIDVERVPERKMKRGN